MTGGTVPRPDGAGRSDLTVDLDGGGDLVGHEAGRLPARTLVRDVGAVVGAALVVQLIVPFRHDLPAHVLGGGGLALLMLGLGGRVLPGGRTARAVWAWTIVLATTWAAEVVLSGPFDPVDLSFSMAGALVVMPSAIDLGSADAVDRWRAVAVGVAMVAVALAYRHGIERIT